MHWVVEKGILQNVSATKDENEKIANGPWQEKLATEKQYGKMFKSSSFRLFTQTSGTRINLLRSRLVFCLESRVVIILSLLRVLFKGLVWTHISPVRDTQPDISNPRGARADART